MKSGASGEAEQPAKPDGLHSVKLNLPNEFLPLSMCLHDQGVD